MERMLRGLVHCGEQGVVLRLELRDARREAPLRASGTVQVDEAAQQYYY
jgi:hypothetical protein